MKVLRGTVHHAQDAIKGPGGICLGGRHSKPSGGATQADQRENEQKRKTSQTRPLSCMDVMLMKALGIVTYKIDARARSHVTREHSCARTEPRLMVNLHLVGNYRALVIAHWFDPGDREIPAVEFGQRFLQRGVQVVLKC